MIRPIVQKITTLRDLGLVSTAISKVMARRRNVLIGEAMAAGRFVEFDFTEKSKRKGGGKKKTTLRARIVSNREQDEHSVVEVVAPVRFASARMEVPKIWLRDIPDHIQKQLETMVEESQDAPVPENLEEGNEA